MRNFMCQISILILRCFCFFFKSFLLFFFKSSLLFNSSEKYISVQKFVNFPLDLTKHREIREAKSTCLNIFWKKVFKRNEQFFYQEQKNWIPFWMIHVHTIHLHSREWKSIVGRLIQEQLTFVAFQSDINTNCIDQAHNWTVQIQLLPFVRTRKMKHRNMNLTYKNRW